MSPFDRSTMLERLGGDAELLDEVLELFVEECDAMVNGVRQAVQSRDSGDLRAAAHTLKGALLNIAAEPSADAARKLELMGRDEDLAGVEGALADLERTISELRGELPASA